MKNGKGFMQGYNAQAVANDRQIIVAAEVTQDQNDQQQLHPMIGRAVENLEEAGETKLPKVALADAGYPSEKALAHPLPGNIEAIVATKKGRTGANDQLASSQGPDSEEGHRNGADEPEDPNQTRKSPVQAQGADHRTGLWPDQIWPAASRQVQSTGEGCVRQ